MANNQDGIELGTLGDVVGGTTAASANVISGNNQYGLVIERSSEGILVEGNDIGTDATGKQPLGNGSDGVHIQDNAVSNTIGGSAAKDGNIIAYNGGTGVSVTASAVSNPILTNSIFANSNQGIVLSGNGNALQVAPVLTSAVSSGSSTVVQGTLTASPNATYEIQFFANPAADPSGFGQGQTYLGTETVTANGGGVASISFTVKPALATGEVVSATATSPANNTSAFSNDVTVTKATAPAVSTPVVKLASLSLVSAPAAPGVQDDPVVTALAVDQLKAKRDRRTIEAVAAKREHFIKLRTSHLQGATIRVPVRTLRRKQE